MIMRQCQVRSASMLGGATLVPASFSDQQTTGAASSAVRCFPLLLANPYHDWVKRSSMDLTRT